MIRNSPKVSIVIPVYNAEKYINQCLRSILIQDFQDFEILLINDGSSDKSEEICHHYSCLDSRIRIYNKSNGGVSSARNLGLLKAKGEWVTFVDADDMLKVDALSRLYNNIGSKVEFVMCGYEYLMDDSITYSTYGKQGTDNYDIYCRDEGIKHMFKNDYWSWFICSKMFKRDILVRNNILFDTNLYHGEDKLFIITYLCFLQKKIAVSHVPIYTYRIHNESVEGRGYSTYNEKNLTGFIATVLIYKKLIQLNTTNENKYLALNDLINSYNVQRRMIKLYKNRRNYKFQVSLNKLFFDLISPIEYMLFIFLRKLAVYFPIIQIPLTNFWASKYEKY